MVKLSCLRSKSDSSLVRTYNMSQEVVSTRAINSRLEILTYVQNDDDKWLM
jgi:hypothetical protein